MTITISKSNLRNKLSFLRDDGSHTSIDLGPSLPNHDLAHFVIEKHLNLEKGFYGNINSGYSFEQLNDPSVIRTLDPESMIAEVLTRHLQALEGQSRK